MPSSWCIFIINIYEPVFVEVGHFIFPSPQGNFSPRGPELFLQIQVTQYIEHSITQINEPKNSHQKIHRNVPYHHYVSLGSFTLIWV